MDRHRPMTERHEQSSDPTLLFERQGGVATLTLNRPEARNALTTGLFLEMERVLLEVEADDAVRAVVLTGAGRSVSAGADLKPVSKEERRRSEAPSFPGDAGGDILERGNRCILRVRELAKPVLGSINGDAVGIGCSLALATDLRIASETARFGVVFSRIGLGPDGGASALLRVLVGPSKALELLFTGDSWTPPTRCGWDSSIVWWRRTPWPTPRASSPSGSPAGPPSPTAPPRPPSTRAPTCPSRAFSISRPATSGWSAVPTT